MAATSVCEASACRYNLVMNDSTSSTQLLAPDILQRFAGHPLLEQPERAFDYSRFLVRALTVDDGLVDWVLSHPASRGYVAGEIAGSIEGPLADAADADALYRELRRCRRRCMSLIAWADLTGVYRLDDTLAALSELADTLIAKTLDRLHDDLCARHGTPIGRNSGAPMRMVVLALGKLGGSELNFSSDVDLIFTFPESGETDGPKPSPTRSFSSVSDATWCATWMSHPRMVSCSVPICAFDPMAAVVPWHCHSAPWSTTTRPMVATGNAMR
jgi:glutamine synthetase adenylyltransferase